MGRRVLKRTRIKKMLFKGAETEDLRQCMMQNLQERCTRGVAYAVRLSLVAQGEGGGGGESAESGGEEVSVK